MHVPPSVLVVVPALNEAEFIETVVRRLLSTVPPDQIIRLVVADGGSHDGTQAIVERLAAADARIKLLHNPGRIQSAAVNGAVRAYGAGCDVLIRCDAHSIYPEDFIVKLLKSLQNSQANSVVVPMDSVGDTCLRRAIAWVSDTPVGSGGAAHRGGTRSGWVDHGHHAAFKMSTFVGAGGYDESFSHNEDAEYDCRQKAIGSSIFLDSQIRIGYFARGSFTGLWRQYFAYGCGRSRTVRRHPGSLRLRQFAVPANLILIVLCAVVWRWQPYAAAWPVLYLVALCVTGAALALRHRSVCGFLAAPAALVMHIGYGVGFGYGLMAYREPRWRRDSAKPLFNDI